MFKIAIVGAGFAGLSVCWHLLQNLPCQVTIFDPLGIGGGASGVSTGLLHPFPGRLALRSWLAAEGMEATNALLCVAEKALGRPVAQRTGLFRIAVQAAQRRAFCERAREDPEAIWMPNIQAQIPMAINAPGLWIPSGITVFSGLYLEGLWKACSMQGAQLEEAKIGFLGDLKPFDAAVLCSGSEIFQFPECAHLPLEPVKGQTLLCHWDTPLESGLAGLGHITPTENPELCQIGSTYERGFLDLAPTPEAAYKLIEMVGAFYPPAKEFRVISQVAGIRMTLRGGYRPLTAQIAPRVWAFTGLGSRGLLYHAVLGHRLALRLKDLCK